jgi:hypothetical protein
MPRVTVPISSRKTRRDWFRILRDLMAAGISMSSVARKCDHDVCTVRNWAEGGEPKESDARIVLAMYARHCPVQYRAHQRHFEISVTVDAVTDLGETRSLPFYEEPVE